MRLPEVADVVIDAPRLVPPHHGQEMADQHCEKQHGEDGFARMDLIHRDHAAGEAALL
jgi:hypothetical protein